MGRRSTQVLIYRREDPEDDEAEEMVDTEQCMPVGERKGCAFHRDSTIPQEISVVEESVALKV